MNELQQYHELTKHSVARLQANPHYLDWAIQPRPFKVYSGLAPIPLPHELGTSAVPALDAIMSSTATARGEVVPELRTLARLLYYSAGITRKKVYPGGGEHYFRAAACTGALYHIDAYLVGGQIPGLDAGVYHFGPQDFALRRLRAGDYRATVIHATAAAPAIREAPVVLVFTSTFWRNSWKYQSRAYRHCFWDSGTILANFLAAAAADGIPVEIVLGFVDAEINQLLGLDTAREVALALVAVGRRTVVAPEPSPPVPALSYETEPLSSREVDYPAIRAAHTASSLASPEEVAPWRRPLPARVFPAPAGRTFPLRPLRSRPAEPIEQVILRRGSTRTFAHVPITFLQLSTLIQCASADVALDIGSAAAPDAASLCDLYLIVHAVDGLPPGTYVYHPKEHVLELLREGNFRREAGHLGLGQELPADAAVNLYWLCDLDFVFAQLGNRGYRAAQLEGAIAGGRAYLAAYAMHIGATGLTFFDDDVTQFFSPHAAGKSVMFLVAVGKSARRAAPH